MWQPARIHHDHDARLNGRAWPDGGRRGGMGGVEGFVREFREGDVDRGAGGGGGGEGRKYAGVRGELRGKSKAMALLIRRGWHGREAGPGRCRIGAQLLTQFSK